MAQKSAVSALQEYCAQNKVPAPVYDWINAGDGSYICRVEFMNIVADGQGRSKGDAKQLAASNLIKRMSGDYPDINNVCTANMIESPTADMIAKLRDYCVQQHHPLPIFEIVQQGGSPDAPEFIALCTVASIRRYGTSENKKDAKQKAAQTMYRLISNTGTKFVDELQIATIGQAIEDIEAERYHKIKTYRELTESQVAEDPPGILLSDRHNYFMNLFPNLKAEAWRVLRNPAYADDYQRQAMDVFRALKITPRIKKFSSEKSMEKMVQIDTNCEYDAVFANVESEVYQSVLSYFRDMLY